MEPPNVSRISELRTHIENFRAMYKSEMKRARQERQYLLDGVKKAEEEIRKLEKA